MNGVAGKGSAAAANEAASDLVARGAGVLDKLFADRIGFLRQLLDKPRPAARVDASLATTDLLFHERLDSVLQTALDPSYVIARVHLGVGANELLRTCQSRAALFGDARADRLLPVFSATLFVPLAAATVLIGAAHDDDRATVVLAAGDGLLLDSRMRAELVGGATPLALLVGFTRAWFREPLAAPAEPPIDMSLSDFLRLPAKGRARLLWRFDRYLQHRHRLLIYQAADRLPHLIGAPIKRALRGWASSY